MEIDVQAYDTGGTGPIVIRLGRLSLSVNLLDLIVDHKTDPKGGPIVSRWPGQPFQHGHQCVNQVEAVRGLLEQWLADLKADAAESIADTPIVVEG